ncbi:MAG: mutator protein MutT [Acidimicrobiales bacterium]|jgi:mutator protein MutT
MSNRHNVHAAVFVVLERDDTVFILRRANTGWADGMWTLPSGHIDQGQTAVEAAIVESKEEAGITILPEHLEFIHVHHVFDVYVNYYFRATQWEGEPMLGEPELCSEVQWCKRTELPQDTIMHVLKMISDVDAGLQFSDIENDPNPSSPETYVQ